MGVKRISEVAYYIELMRHQCILCSKLGFRRLRLLQYHNYARNCAVHYNMYHAEFIKRKHQNPECVAGRDRKFEALV